MIDKIKKKLGEFLRNLKNRYSNKDYEVKYWVKNGIKKGKDFYSLYLEKFNVSEEDFYTKKVADFGCGPFGGLLSVLDVAGCYPIDILAEKYNEWGKCRRKIYLFDGKRVMLEDSIVDVVFCCNAIDHTKHPENIIKEIGRILKSDGILYLHVHLRTQDELNPGHPMAWDESVFDILFKGFEKKFCYIEDRDYVNGNEHKTLYAGLVCKK